MFLTRFAINPRRRGAGRLLASPQAMHAAVLAGFPDPTPAPEGRILWRLDRRGHESTLFVVSPERPDFTHLVEQAGWPTTATWETRDYSPLLDRMAAGQRWAFRLRANPTRSAANDERGRRGSVRALLKEPEQRNWLLAQAERRGFRVVVKAVGDTELHDLIVRDSETVTFARQGRPVTITQVVFDGVLEVVDPERFRTALTHGIGRAKGYGCGLLTLAPVASASPPPARQE